MTPMFLCFEMSVWEKRKRLLQEFIMGTSEALALNKVLAKLSSEWLEDIHGMRSCGLSHNSTPSEFDGGKKLDVK